jgi:PEP-CTERM motif
MVLIVVTDRRYSRIMARLLRRHPLSLVAALWMLVPCASQVGAGTISSERSGSFGDTSNPFPKGGANGANWDGLNTTLLGTPVTAGQVGLPGVGTDPAVVVGSGWQEFNWGNASGAADSQGPFTFTSAIATNLLVTDAFVDGDQFAVFNYGVFIGTTSAPSNDGFSDPNPYADFADPRFSSGTFLLGPGSYSITLETIGTAGGYSSGGAYLQVEAQGAPVAEPATVTMLGMGVVSLLGYGWRRRKPAM